MYLKICQHRNIVTFLHPENYPELMEDSESAGGHDYLQKCQEVKTHAEEIKTQCNSE